MKRLPNPKNGSHFWVAGDYCDKSWHVSFFQISRTIYGCAVNGGVLEVLHAARPAASLYDLDLSQEIECMWWPSGRYLLQRGSCPKQKSSWNQEPMMEKETAMWQWQCRNVISESKPSLEPRPLQIICTVVTNKIPHLDLQRLCFWRRWMPQSWHARSQSSPAWHRTWLPMNCEKLQR